MYIVILIFLLALLWDVSLGRVPNQLVYAGFLFSQLWLLYSESLYVATKAIIGGIVILIILFPLFAIGCLGGGDIKLMMLLASVCSVKDSIQIIFGAFVIGAIIGLIRLVKSRSLVSRLHFFRQYVNEVHSSKTIKKYDTPNLLQGNITEYQIHFTIPLFISVLLNLGGQINI